MRVAEIRHGELIFNWTESTDHPTSLYYAINSTCGSCPNMTNTTMTTCSDLSLSTVLTMCTFSVCSVACGAIGSPSPPMTVTLGGISLSESPSSSLSLSLSVSVSVSQVSLSRLNWSLLILQISMRDYSILVPGVPTVSVIPQYSLNKLTEIIVRVEQNVSHNFL